MDSLNLYWFVIAERALQLIHDDERYPLLQRQLDKIAAAIG